MTASEEAAGVTLGEFLQKREDGREVARRVEKARYWEHELDDIEDDHK